MTEYKPRIGNVGVVVRVDMQEDLSQVTDTKFIVKKPDGKSYTWTPASIDGQTKLTYVVQSGDFDQIGLYWLWPAFKLGAWEGNCEAVSFYVYD